MPSKRKSIREGFSIIELLVVVSVMVFMSGLAIPYYHNHTQSKKLEQQVQQIIDVFSLARKKTQANDTDNLTCNVFNGHRVIFTCGATCSVYRLRLCCATGCAVLQDLQLYTIDPDLTVSLSGSSTIQFRPLTQDTTLTGNTVITVRNPAISKCIAITINPQGLIIEGPKITC